MTDQPKKDSSFELDTLEVYANGIHRAIEAAKRAGFELVVTPNDHGPYLDLGDPARDRLTPLAQCFNREEFDHGHHE